MFDTMYNLDIQILNSIYGLSGNALVDIVIVAISRMGNYGVVWIIIALCLSLNKKTRKVSVMIGVVLIISTFLCNGVLKILIGRPRPYVMLGIKILITDPIGDSFPSGHSTSSFAVAGILAMNLKIYGKWFLILAGAIAFSRIYLYVHYPTDVLAGVLLGSACAIGVTKLFNIFSRRYYTGRI